MSIQSYQQQGPLPFGSGHFYSPATPHPLECLSYKPSSYDPGSSALLVVMHGAQRDARDYRDYSKDLAEQTGALVIAPLFEAHDYTLWRYRTGGMFLKDHHGHSSSTSNHNHNHQQHSKKKGSKRGGEHDDWGEEVGEQGLRLAPEEQWLAVILYRCIATVRLLESSSSMPYSFFAHSAGAQSLHRLLLFRPDPSATAIILANSGSYTFPMPGWDFPYGLKGLPPEVTTASPSLLPSLLKKFVEAPFTIASGTEDHDTEGPHMDMSELAMLEGLNRRARAKAVFETYRSLAHDQGWHFAWTFIDVQGVGHDGHAMIQSPEVGRALALHTSTSSSRMASVEVQPDGQHYQADYQRHDHHHHHDRRQQQQEQRRRVGMTRAGGAGSTSTTTTSSTGGGRAK